MYTEAQLKTLRRLIREETVSRWAVADQILIMIPPKRSGDGRWVCWEVADLSKKCGLSSSTLHGYRSTAYRHPANSRDLNLSFDAHFSNTPENVKKIAKGELSATKSMAGLHSACRRVLDAARNHTLSETQLRRLTIRELHYFFK